MNGEYVVIGAFRGMFFTHQLMALGSGDGFPDDLTHSIWVYSGKFHADRFEDEYNPDKFRKHGSFLLGNVPKVEVSVDSNGDFQEPRVYNFVQLLLIEPRVVKAYVLNGKTYGEVESRAYGITAKYPLVKPADPNQNNYSTPPLVGEDYVESVIPEGPSTYDDTLSHINKGCGTISVGCLPRVWKLFLLLLVILFILGLFDGCEGEDDQCVLRDRTRQELAIEKIRRDSAQVEYDRNLMNAIAGYGTIYFFRNSTDFHVNSTGNNSPISRIYKLMDAYSEKKFVIEGFHSGLGLEGPSDLDLLRALRMRDSLVAMGIDVQRLSLRARGDSVLLDPKCEMSRFFVSKQISREYNPNMRVEVKVDTSHE